MTSPDIIQLNCLAPSSPSTWPLNLSPLPQRDTERRWGARRRAQAKVSLSERCFQNTRFSTIAKSVPSQKEDLRGKMISVGAGVGAKSKKMIQTTIPWKSTRSEVVRGGQEMSLPEQTVLPPTTILYEPCSTHDPIAKFNPLSPPILVPLGVEGSEEVPCIVKQLPTCIDNPINHGDHQICIESLGLCKGYSKENVSEMDDTQQVTEVTKDPSQEWGQDDEDWLGQKTIEKRVKDGNLVVVGGWL